MSIPLLQNGPSNGQLSASLVREPLISHYCPPRGSFLKSMREGNQIPYYVLTREMVLVWYPFDYMSDTFPQRRSTSTSFSVYVKTGVTLRSPSSFWKSVDSD